MAGEGEGAAWGPFQIWRNHPGESPGAEGERKDLPGTVPEGCPEASGVQKKTGRRESRFEAQKEYDSLEKEARLLEGQQGEMLLAEERIGQAQKAERLWKVLQDFLQDRRT